MIAQHYSKSNEHYTPSEIIHAAWETMGGIDLDPATTEDVNSRLVGASSFYTKETNGLDKPWHGRVWLNPPGGITEDGGSNAARWWNKLASEYIVGNVQQACFLGFTLEILRSAQDYVWPGDFPFCIPSSRLHFLKRHDDGTFQKQGQPSHANVVVYLPPMITYVESSKAFRKAFEGIGKVRC